MKQVQRKVSRYCYFRPNIKGMIAHILEDMHTDEKLIIWKCIFFDL